MYKFEIFFWFFMFFITNKSLLMYDNEFCFAYFTQVKRKKKAAAASAKILEAEKRNKVRKMRFMFSKTRNKRTTAKQEA